MREHRNAPIDPDAWLTAAEEDCRRARIAVRFAADRTPGGPGRDHAPAPARRRRGATAIAAALIGATLLGGGTLAARLQADQRAPALVMVTADGLTAG